MPRPLAAASLPSRMAFIPSPPVSGVHLGPLHVHFYGVMYVVAITIAVYITARRWAAAGGNRELVYDVVLWVVPAGIVGARIYFDVTTPFDITPHTWWGPLAVWKGGLGVWGGITAGALVGVWRVRRPGQRRPVHERGRARPAGRAGDRAHRQLLQPGAVRQAEHAAVGAGDQPGRPAGRGHTARRPEVRHLPAVVPLRAGLRPGVGRAAGLARASPPDQTPGAVRPLRRGVLGVPDLRGDDQDRLLGPRAGAAAQLLHRGADDRGRARVVHPDSISRYLDSMEPLWRI